MWLDSQFRNENIISKACGNRCQPTEIRRKSNAIVWKMLSPCCGIVHHRSFGMAVENGWEPAERFRNCDGSIQVRLTRVVQISECSECLQKHNEKAISYHTLTANALQDLCMYICWRITQITDDKHEIANRRQTFLPLTSMHDWEMQASTTEKMKGLLFLQHCSAAVPFGWKPPHLMKSNIAWTYPEWRLILKHHNLKWNRLRKIMPKAIELKYVNATK